MTASPYLIGIGAGVVAAVLFASLANNTLLAVMLFYLTPLPILLAGIGWGSRAAQIAFATAVLLVGLVLHLTTAIAFALAVGLPGLVLSYLMLLHRDVVPAAAGQPAVEWYPLGRMIAWASLMAGGLIALGLLLLGNDGEGYRSAVRAMFDQTSLGQLREMLGADLTDVQYDQFVARLTRYILPAFAAASWLLVILANLWIATKSASISGQLARPLPSLTMLHYPPFLLAGFLVSLLLSFASGIVGLAGTAFLGAISCAYLILGLAVMHVAAAGSQFKPLVLAVLYAGLMLTPWVAPITILLGLIEPLLQLRRRILERAAPPAGPAGPHS
jgi:hypothetical protein